MKLADKRSNKCASSSQLVPSPATRKLTASSCLRAPSCTRHQRQFVSSSSSQTNGRCRPDSRGASARRTKNNRTSESPESPSSCNAKVINQLNWCKSNTNIQARRHSNSMSKCSSRSILALSLLVAIVGASRQARAFQTVPDGQSTSACFGGLQTFEKISMSSFEPSPILTASSGPAAPANSNQQQPPAFSQAGGILIQQDDQALTSECVNLCKSQSNCLSFVIDYNKFECKSYAVTQQQLQQQWAPNHDDTLAKRSSNASLAESAGPENLASSESSSPPGQQQQRMLLPSASANYFEKICLAGVATRQEFVQVCGQDRLWAVERVVDAFLDGFIEKEITNVNTKDECSKLCLFEGQFVCRSADYDQNNRLCRLSKEDRRTQPQAFRTNLRPGITGRHYIENQCATPGPSSCVYETKRNVGVVSMDALKFAQSVNDCQMKCSQEQTFNCRSYSYHNNRCFLSGDDSVSLSSLVKLPAKTGWQFGERKCVVELCTKGIFTYEKTSGFILRSALSTTIDLLASSGSAHAARYRMAGPLEGSDGPAGPDSMSTAEANTNRLLRRNYQPLDDEPHAYVSDDLPHAADDTLNASGSSQRHQQRPAANRSSLAGHHNSGSNLAITGNCRQACDSGYLNCPSFTIDYKNNRCQRLDRNSQGRHQDLVARDGHSYFEKICLRVPEIMSMCQDKYWIFERVLGYELAPHLYDKTLKFVLSRRDCEEYCLEERQFQCRSALYNDDTSDCKLSRTDRRLLAGQDGGYYRNFNAKVSYLENQCIRNHQLERDQQCRYEQPKDEPSYPTFTEIIEPASGAPANNVSAGEHSGPHGLAYCEQLCNDNAQFECHSFGYYSSTNQCFLSGDDMVSVGESAVTLSPGFVYYEKKCHSPAAPTPATRPTSTTAAGPTIGPVTSGDSTDGTLGTFTSAPVPNLPTSPAIVSTTGGTTSGAATGAAAGNQPTEQLTTTRVPPPLPQVIPLSATQQQTNINININPASGPAHNRPSSGALPAAADGPSGGAADESTPGDRSPPQADNGTQETGADMDADTYKCGQGNVFTYQRIAGFEPIGGFLTLLLHDNQQPGIVDECAQLCKRAYECRAFVVDYTSNQCYAMLENSSVGQLSLRQSLGRDYFEGFCLGQQHLYVDNGGGHSCANKTWISDRIVDQAVIGVQAQQVIEQSDRTRCRLACFEQRLFYCKSAMYDSQTKECRLYGIDRESTLHMSLLFTKGVDFFENQCHITASQCPYDAIERDLTIVSATKSLQAHSTFDCEQACNDEQTFNCRSYTYLHNYPDQLPNVCILSADSRSTSQKGSIRERKRTLYAERNCFNRKPRRPNSSSGDAATGLMGSPTSSQAATGGTFTQPIAKPVGDQPTISFNLLGSAAGQNNNHATHPFKPIVLDQSSLPAQDLANSLQPGSTAGDLPGGQAGTICEPHQYTFERTFGYDFRFARRERAPVPQSLGVVVACQQECLLREDRCQAFVVEYSLPYQGCFLLDSSVGANKRLLSRATNMAYFEKICLVRTGINNDLAVMQSLAPSVQLQQLETSSLQHGASSPELAIGATEQQHNQLVQDNPWPQTGPNQLPYYMQQQRLVQQYPSRACPRLWSFERFINSNFTLAPERIVANVLSRLLCEQYCINEARFICRSATYDYNNLTCRLFKETRRSTLSQFVPVTEVHNSSNLTPTKNARQSLAANYEQLAGSPNIDYVENQCVQQPSSCQYRPIYDSFSPFIDKIVASVSLSDCQRQCDSEQLFRCRAINYDPANKECMLLNEDLVTLDRGQQSLIERKNIIYSEKGNCELVSVQCNPQEMLVSINFDSPFRGRILANGNPEQCFIIGDGQTTIHFPIVFGPKCNSRQEGHNTFVNEVVIQQHPVIMTDSDKTVRVMCSFEAPDQTITLKNPSTNGAGKAGIDVSNNPENSRTRHDRPPFNSVISNKSSPPMVILRILDLNDRDATMINLGDDLVLKIQMQSGDQSQQQASALSIFARNLRARSSNGESLLLIDNDGCPVDNAVFPALSIDPRDGKSLYSTFKAFRFPSSGLVNFEVQIRFCPERCQPVQCNRGQLQSYGRRRRRRRKREAQVTPTNVFSLSDNFEMINNPDETVTQFIETVNPSVDHQIESKTENNSLLVMSSNQSENYHQNRSIAIPDAGEIMKPGRAFQVLREMLLSDSQPLYSQTINTTADVTATVDTSQVIDSSSTSSPTASINTNDNLANTRTLAANDTNNYRSSNVLPDIAPDTNDYSSKYPATETGSQDFPLSPTPIVPSEEFHTTSGTTPMPEFVINDAISNGDNFAESNTGSTQSEITTLTTTLANKEQHSTTRPISEDGPKRERPLSENALTGSTNRHLSADYQSVVPPPILTHVSQRIVPNYLGRPMSFNSQHSQANSVLTQHAITEAQLRPDTSQSHSIDFSVIGDPRFSPPELSSGGQIIPEISHHQEHSGFVVNKQRHPPITTSVISNSHPGHSGDVVNSYPTIKESAPAVNVDYSSTRWKYQQGLGTQFEPITTPVTTETPFTTTVSSVHKNIGAASDYPAPYDHYGITNEAYQSTRPQLPRTNSRASAAEVPLKFSILVGDQNHNRIGSAIGSASWPSAHVEDLNAATESGLSVKNSENHKYGKDNSDTSGEHRNSSVIDFEASQQSKRPPVMSNTETNLHSINNTSSSNADRPLDFANLDNNVTAISSSGPDISGDTNTNFDMLPPDNSLDPLLQQPTNNRSSLTPAIQSQAELAHADCSIDSASSRLWLIVWTGTIVIVLNVGLVVISLIIYFKKIHLSGRHKVKSIHRSHGCGGFGKKSKNGRNHLSTSLEASEHFFAKLNGQQTRATTRSSSIKPLQSTQARSHINQSTGEFQWPNLSSSSSHSTISSITCPPPPAMTTMIPRSNNRNGHLLQHHDLGHLQQIVTQRSTAPIYQSEFYNINEIDNDDEEDDNIITCTVNHGFEHDDDDSTKQFSNSKDQNHTMEPSTSFDNHKNFVAVSCGKSNKTKDCDIKQSNCHLMSKRFLNEDDQYSTNANKNDAPW